MSVPQINLPKRPHGRPPLPIKGSRGYLCECIFDPPAGVSEGDEKRFRLINNHVWVTESVSGYSEACEQRPGRWTSATSAARFRSERRRGSCGHQRRRNPHGNDLGAHSLPPFPLFERGGVNALFFELLPDPHWVAYVDLGGSWVGWELEDKTTGRLPASSSPSPPYPFTGSKAAHPSLPPCPLSPRSLSLRIAMGLLTPDDEYHPFESKFYDSAALREFLSHAFLRHTTQFIFRAEAWQDFVQKNSFFLLFMWNRNFSFFYFF